MIKIANNNLQKYGTRGAALSLPAVWLQDNKIKPGDVIPIYRINVNGTDLLVLSKKEITSNLRLLESESNLKKDDC